jgi:hypothetical protein
MDDGSFKSINQELEEFWQSRERIRRTIARPMVPPLGDGLAKNYRQMLDLTKHIRKEGAIELMAEVDRHIERWSAVSPSQ